MPIGAAKAAMLGVDDGMVDVLVELWGSGGGGGDGAGGSTTGGKGGILAFTLRVPRGHILQLYVPSSGKGANGSMSGRPGGVGWGNGGVGNSQDSNQESGGGGASAAVEDEDSNLLAVAAGGGGGSSHTGHTPVNGYDGAPRSSGGSLAPSNTGGHSNKAGAPGTSGSGSGLAGGGGAGADNTNPGGDGSYCNGGQAKLDTTRHEITRDTTAEASMTPKAGGYATADGTDGQIRITDDSGATTYSTPGSTPTHTVA